MNEVWTSAFVGLEVVVGFGLVVGVAGVAGRVKAARADAQERPRDTRQAGGQPKANNNLKSGAKGADTKRGWIASILFPLVKPPT